MVRIGESVAVSAALILIALGSAAVYYINSGRLSLDEGIYCGDVAFSVPPGKYRLNYTMDVTRLAGTEEAVIMFEFTLDNTTCSSISGVAYTAGVMGIAWGSPTRLGPFILPRLNETIQVNILPLPPYTPQAIAGYYPVVAVETSRGLLETPYGTVPVRIYAYTQFYNTEQGVLTEATTLYYEDDTGVLVGVDYNLFQGPVRVYAYNMRLSSLEVQPTGAQITVKDPLTAMALVSLSGVVGGIALALGVAEAASGGGRRSDQEAREATGTQ